MKRLLFILLGLLSVGIKAQPLQRYTTERGLMGTQFRMIFYAPDSVMANKVIRAVYARMDTLNQIMSDYLDGSEINSLSETAGSGRWVRISPDLFGVLAKARWVAEKSGGRFDPTIGPLSQLWRRAVRRQQFPSKAELQQARRVVGYTLLKLDTATRSAQLLRPGMKLDVGGIGQGFAIDEALKVVHALGIHSVLIDIGGDILLGDAPPNQPGWRIDVGSGKANDADTMTLTLTHAAITTSGDTYRYLEHKGKRYSHIMDPRNGLGLRHFTRATVLAPDGWRADALTKVFSVAGWRKCRHLLKRFPQTELYLLENKSGRLRRWKSAGFK